MGNDSAKRSVFIDCGKVAAITAVLLDHFYYATYINDFVRACSFYAVGLFVFLSGITAYKSFERHGDEAIPKTVFRHLKSVIIPYMVACAVYEICRNRAFDLQLWFREVTKFSSIGGFYFVAFFLQLVLISPLLFKFIRRAEKSRGYGAAFAITASAAYLIGYYAKFKTSMFDLYGAGQYLFGGSYLLLYVLGMLFAVKDFRFKTPAKAGLSTLAALFAFFYEADFFYINREVINNYTSYSHLWQRNPPELFFIIFILISVWLVFSAVSFAGFYKTGSRITAFIARFGKYSYFIYLYHGICLEVVPYLVKGNMHYSVRNFIISMLCVFIPIGAKWLVDKFRLWLNDIR